MSDYDKILEQKKKEERKKELKEAAVGTLMIPVAMVGMFILGIIILFIIMGISNFLGIKPAGSSRSYCSDESLWDSSCDDPPEDYYHPY